MIISAVNAMTMTPARAAWIFASRKPGGHGEQGKEGAAVVVLRPPGRAGDRVAAGADAGRLAGHAGGRAGGVSDGGARRPESHPAVVGRSTSSFSFPARSRAGCWAGS